MNTERTPRGALSRVFHRDVGAFQLLCDARYLGTLPNSDLAQWWAWL